MSQAELAERAKVTRPYITMLEAGKRGKPSLEVLGRLAVALGTSLAELTKETQMKALSDALRAGAEKEYEYRRGDIMVLDSSSGHMQCRKCNAVWWANLRPGGHYHRGSWTCHNCGANSKGTGRE
jgi:transcriptional regulator with XRE-family HTH domain